MKKLWAHLVHYYRNHLSGIALLWVLVFTALIIVGNEHYDFYHKYITNCNNQYLKTAYYMLLYSVAYVGALVIEAAVRKDFSVLKQGRFWWAMWTAMLLYVLRGLEWPYYSLVADSAPTGLVDVYFKLLYNGAGLLLIMLPTWWYWRMSKDYTQQPFYGFRSRGLSFAPYWLLVALMVPVIFYASRDASFHTMYPRYRFLNMPPSTPYYSFYTFLYELVYSLDFAVTEFFFRGFFILALGKFIGARAILPMCVFYVTIHFGKPLAEVVSSFFGGLLLGVIAWETKSIYGGIIVHLGIALLMELFGLWA